MGVCPTLSCPTLSVSHIIRNGHEMCDPQLGWVAVQPPCPAELECDEAADACVVPPIPTVSTWGLVTLALVILTLAKLHRSSLTESPGR